METLQPTSGFTSEASLSGNLPHTPPYTPHHPVKRRLERSDSPASARSLHPAETESPATKPPKRAVHDEVEIEELTEGDVGYITDIDVVYPEELEEVDSETEEDEQNTSDEDESDSGISKEFSRLGCDDGAEAEFERRRRAKRARRRSTLRTFKRSHSQSVKSESETFDTEAMGDHDLGVSARRLRRRVRGPDGVRIQLKDTPRSSVEPGGRLAPAAEIHERRHNADDVEMTNTNTAMDVDSD